jgi:hypothetical protein
MSTVGAAESPRHEVMVVKLGGTAERQTHRNSFIRKGRPKGQPRSTVRKMLVGACLPTQKSSMNTVKADSQLFVLSLKYEQFTQPLCSR